MPYDTLLLGQREGVLTITVNRPEVLNLIHVRGGAKDG